MNNRNKNSNNNNSVSKEIQSFSINTNIETMTPTIILPFRTNNKSNYNVRTLLDSGSSI